MKTARFIPRRSVMEGCRHAGRLQRAERIKRIRMRLLDSWRHADLEHRLWIRERALRALEVFPARWSRPGQ
jgi:hypothetical protein